MTSLRMLSEPGCVCLVGVECSFSLRDPGIVLRGLLLSRRVFCLSRADSRSYVLETGEKSQGFQTSKWCYYDQCSGALLGFGFPGLWTLLKQILKSRHRKRHGNQYEGVMGKEPP